MFPVDLGSTNEHTRGLNNSAIVLGAAQEAGRRYEPTIPRFFTINRAATVRFFFVCLYVYAVLARRYSGSIYTDLSPHFSRTIHKESVGRRTLSCHTAEIQQRYAE